MSGVARAGSRRGNTRHSGSGAAHPLRPADHRHRQRHRMRFPTATASPPATMVSPMSAKAAAIGIVVADLSVSITFYEHFGLSFADREHGHTEADLGNGLRLMLDTEESIQSFTSAWTRPFGSPRTTVCFEFDTPADVDAKFAELMDAGYHGLRGPWNAPWGQRYASIIDPDGSGVDLFARL